jgi:hypothetical protein
VAAAAVAVVPPGVAAAAPGVPPAGVVGVELLAAPAPCVPLMLRLYRMPLFWRHSQLCRGGRQLLADTRASVTTDHKMVGPR